jgi:hypothetical protein
VKTTLAEKRIAVFYKSTVMPFINYILLVYKELPVINKHQTSLLSKDYLGDLFFNIIKPYSSFPVFG